MDTTRPVLSPPVALAQVASLVLARSALRLLLRGVRLVRRWLARRPALPSQAGQATAEYALVLLGAAVVAIALVTWATGSGRVGDLFDRVFDELVSRL
jgi:hypothetical protein